VITKARKSQIDCGQKEAVKEKAFEIWGRFGRCCARMIGAGAVVWVILDPKLGLVSLIWD
jgi:hypothetical protein